MEEALRRRAHLAHEEIRAGGLRGEALRARLASVPFRDRDVFVDAMLGVEEPPPPDEELPRGAVPYLPCGVDEIVAMTDEAPLGADELLVDLGSGLGRVVLLAHLLSGARACGIEIQEHLVTAASASTRALGLDAVTFVRGNAAESVPEGSVFFLYAPFNGAMLHAVVARLAEVAARRPVVVCAVGLELEGVAWLRARERRRVALAVYDSVR